MPLIPASASAPSLARDTAYPLNSRLRRNDSRTALSSSTTSTSGLAAAALEDVVGVTLLLCQPVLSHA